MTTYQAENFTDWTGSIYSPSEPLSYILTTLLILGILYSLQPSKSNVPLLIPKRFLELTNSRPKKEFTDHAYELLESWFRQNPEKPVRMYGDSDIVTVLPPKFANEIRNNENLSFSRFTYNAFHAYLPEFEAFREGSRDTNLVQTVIQNDLTKFLNKVTEPLAEETNLALSKIFTEQKDWHSVPLRDSLLKAVAQISSRVFLGEELCRNEDWLRVTKDYTVVSFMAAYELRTWPSWSRHVAHWFLPNCQKSRALVRQAREIIEPVLARRRQDKLVLQEGETCDFNDAIEWFERESKGRFYDPAVAQLILSIAAIHTTTDLVCEVIERIAQNVDIIEPLREEIITVIDEGGWKKSSLYNLRLLDSVIKEAQRLKPIAIVSMRRIATKDVLLSDGTLIPKGEMVAVTCKNMWDEKIHENPNQFDAYRFYNMRRVQGKENWAQLVTTSPEHLGFGHGQHGCPGRFFAANEAKIIIVHLLLQYEWQFANGQVPKPKRSAFSFGTDPTIELEIRKREQTVSL